MSLGRRRPAGAQRTGTPADLLVVGLGNPGADYAGTRHNAGAVAVEVLAQRHGGRLRSRRGLSALTDEVRIEGRRVALAFPQTYMNDSGGAVRKLVARFGIDDLRRLVVIHDELDLPTGRVQVRVGGGLAGHKGLRSIRDCLRATSFVRIRIGVGRPPSAAAGADYVLSQPRSADRDALRAAAARAADAAEAIAAEGPERAMNTFNVRSGDVREGRPGDAG
ncbi:MAG: aminoacyl-tRNA hydrolase [bacterium]|nr:aminoacyl-tRNA hydrolase [bacterium]